MRYSIFSLFLLAGTTSFGQLEFSNDGQILDQSSLNTIDIFDQLRVDIDIRNTSNDTVSWFFSQCRLTDDPNIDQDIILWQSQSDASGIGIQSGVITYPCFEIQNNGILIYSNDSGEYSLYFTVNGTGCESYRLKIIDQVSGSDIDSVDLNFCATLGISEFEQENLTIFPNPAQEELNIEGEVNEVSILALNGQLISQQKTTSLNGVSTISVAELKSGMYIIESTLSTGKLIRQSFVKN